ncbi:MAG TPA: helix-turn-helix domain-containing protein [Woeseiaceae bacterium]|nr:helix-turn-helix domain-containing protein [Woeseiaceae bacterium]
MSSFETALRVAIIGQEILVAAVLLFGRGSRGARLSGALFLVSVSAYLIVSDRLLSEAAAFLLPVLMLLAIIVPYCLWLFARAVFEAAWPRWWILAGFALVAICVWAIFVGGEDYGSDWVNVASIVTHIASLAAVAHSLWIAAKGRPDDLIEQRRRFRVFFIVIVAAQVGVVLVVELLLRGAEPAWLVFLNVAVIAILTLGLAIPLLRLNPEFFAPALAHGRTTTGREAEDLSPSESVLKQALLSAMSEGVYQQSGLNIRMLAEQLGHTEHRLRKLINGRLGFRNFSAFLSSYRIPEAKKVLADAGQVRKPILNIALDLGYGSLGPFNRAFKAATNMTPTEYRQAAHRSKDIKTE